MKKNDNMCIMPWTSFQLDVNGEVRPCCMYSQPDEQSQYRMPNIKKGSIDDVWNGPELQKLRQAFLDGKKPSECNICWTNEDAGIESYRQEYNEREYKVKMDSVIAEPPKIWDLKLSNVCNFKCRMCSPTASSLILKELKAAGAEFPEEDYYLSHKIVGTINEQIFFDNLKYVAEIDLTGGEPLYSKENKDIVEKIANSEYVKNIWIKITTNGSLFNKKFYDYLTKFRKTSIIISIDDVGDRLEYQRHGADWQKIQNNISKIKEYNFELYAKRTVNNYNIWYLEELEQYCKDNNIKLIQNCLHYPEGLSVMSLPLNVKQKIKAKYQTDNKYHTEVLELLEHIRVPAKTYSFEALTEKNDMLRNEIFFEVFPDWAAQF